jgi:hypothetical protein
MYHADRDKGRCDFHGGRRQYLVEQEGQNQPETELNDAPNLSHAMNGWVTTVADIIYSRSVLGRSRQRLFHTPPGQPVRLCFAFQR